MRFIILVSAALMGLLCTPMPVDAQGEATNTETEPRKTVIEGYAGFKLGAFKSESELSEFSDHWVDSSMKGIVLDVFSRPEPFRVYQYSPHCTIYLSFWQNRLHEIRLDFDRMALEFDDIVYARCVAASLRDRLLYRYSRDLVYEDVFVWGPTKPIERSWTAEFVLLDESGSELALRWRRYDLQLTYRTASLSTAIAAAASKESEESISKL